MFTKLTFTMTTMILRICRTGLRHLSSIFLVQLSRVLQETNISEKFVTNKFMLASTWSRWGVMGLASLVLAMLAMIFIQFGISGRMYGEVNDMKLVSSVSGTVSSSDLLAMALVMSIWRSCLGSW